MQEHFKNQLLVALGDKFSSDELTLISDAFDRVSRNYEITEKETSLAVVENDVPYLLKAYVMHMKIRSLSTGTIQSYYRTLLNFYLYLGKDLKEVTTGDIKVYLYDYQRIRNASSSTMELHLTIIKTFYQWLQDEEYITRNPARKIDSIKCEKTVREPLSQLELEMLRNACQTKQEKVIIEALFSTGCRVSELIHIKKTDIDLESKQIKVKGKGNVERIVFINARFEVAMREYFKSRSDETDSLLVTERKPHTAITTSRSIQNVLTELRERAGITKKLSPHVVRHTMATIAVENGMPVESMQKILGHANISTTMIYAHTSLAKAKEQYIRTVI